MFIFSRQSPKTLAAVHTHYSSLKKQLLLAAYVTAVFQTLAQKLQAFKLSAFKHSHSAFIFICSALKLSISALKLNGSAFIFSCSALKLGKLALALCFSAFKLIHSAFKLNDLELKLHGVALSSRLQLSSSAINPLSPTTWS